MTEPMLTSAAYQVADEQNLGLLEDQDILDVHVRHVLPTFTLQPSHFLFFLNIRLRVV